MNLELLKNSPIVLGQTKKGIEGARLFLKNKIEENERIRKEMDPDGDTQANNNENVETQMEKMNEVTKKAMESATKMMGEMSE